MTVVGSIGVALLLAAFFANLVGWLEVRSKLWRNGGTCTTHAPPQIEKNRLRGDLGISLGEERPA